MASFNKIIIVGYIGRDPEIRYTAQGEAVCSFSVATTEKRKDRSGEFQDHTTWFRVTAWRRLAEVANQYLSKGKQVYVEGKLRMEEYTDRDGARRNSLEVTASDIHFLGVRGDETSPSSGGGAGAGASPASKALRPSTPAEPDNQAPSDDDIPF